MKPSTKECKKKRASSSDTEPSSKQPAVERKSFVYPEYEPTLEAVKGVTYDFNAGARIKAAMDFDVQCVLTISDGETNQVMYSRPMTPGKAVLCAKKYYIPYRIEIKSNAGEMLFRHDMDLRGKDVLLQLPYEGALGDTIAWFASVEPFRRKTGCKAHLMLPEFGRKLFEPEYPGIAFHDWDSAKTLRPYASYYLGLFFNGDTDWQPVDFRLLSLHGQASSILGIPEPGHPCVHGSAIAIPKEPYVCIASQASSHAKHWCNPSGWRIVVDYLKKHGYRVLCIDKEHECGCGPVWHHIPYGAEDFTGPLPLSDRAALIKGARFFIGLSSGLSWLAWCCDVPVILIGGITSPTGDFHTPYRVQSRLSCSGCWNDTRYVFDNHDYMWCPVHKGTDRAYECTTSITPEMVIAQISRVESALVAREALAGI